MRCNFIFHSEEQNRCLYCDSVLMSVGENPGSLMMDTQPFDVFLSDADFLKSAGRGELDRKHYIIGSYFRSWSFSSMYFLCRNDFKMGKDYARFFIKPMDFPVLLSLPWVLLNVVDSIVFRFFNLGFCEKCQRKYRLRRGIVGHDKEECEYNRDYTTIVYDIINGRITMTEDEHKKISREKVALGRHSAYQDLCAQKNSYSTFWDIMTILATICLLIYLAVRLMFPLLSQFFQHLEF